MNSSASIGRRSDQPVFTVENLTRRRIVASNVWAAADSSMRRRGLLDVEAFDENAGLWIDPCEAVHTFGMKINLDIVFLDAALRVKKISSQLKPNRITFCLSAKSVLEIQGGSAAAAQLQCGDQLRLHRNTPAIVTDDVNR